ncbi:MAG: elongation factor G, partial [Clostridia bacterium]|nr:elongation factor G [Clostridia bacterium]
FTISLSEIPLVWKNVKINVLDTPGYLDFVGEVKSALRVADSAIIFVDAKAGIEPGVELGWERAEEAKLPTAFFVNKCDDPDGDFGKVFQQLKDRFGSAVCPVYVPMKKGGQFFLLDLIEKKAYSYDAKGKRSEAPFNDEQTAFAAEYEDVLSEAAAATSDDLMNKYFEGEPLTRDELVQALHTGIIEETIVPVYAGSATNLWGIAALLDTVRDSFPSPLHRKEETVIDDEGKEKAEALAPEGDASIFVFKTIADPFVGKLSLFKVMSGSLKKDMTLTNPKTGVSEKMSHIYTVRGKKTTEVDELSFGDIGTVTKVQSLSTGDTLRAGKGLPFKGINFPRSYMTRGISPMKKGEEEKIATGMARLSEEDPTLVFENSAETAQMLISGMGDIHLDIVVSRLESRYKVQVQLSDPKIAYREAIKKTVDIHGRHKKQSGGSGQFGDVWIRFSPSDEPGLTFTTSVVGGAVPKNFYPAVEKGLLEAMQKGVLAGYPMAGLAADLHDGSYHPVDSNEISFKLAARLAYREGLPQANPVLLEPISSLKVCVPESLVGDVMGDLNKRRGRVLGMDANHEKKGYTIVEAEIPNSEMVDYVITLRAMSQGRGSFDMEFVRYEEVPAMYAQKIIAEAKKDEEEE